MINYRQARLIAAQETAHKELSGMKTNRKGAYYFFHMEMGGRLVIDDRCLTEKCRSVFKEHLEPRIACEVKEKDSTEVIQFCTPKKRKHGVMIRTKQRVENVTIWVLEHDEWCLALIYAGIRPGTFSNREAITRFDDLYAKSAHDSITARAALNAITP